MRDRQREAVIAFLNVQRDIVIEHGNDRPNQYGLFRISYNRNGRRHSLMGNAKDTVDDLLCEITRSTWEKLEEEDRKNAGPETT